MGMVRALREIWRVLCADGVLIDFRPLHTGWRMEISTGDRILLVEDGLSDAQRIPRDKSAERALTQAQAEGWLRCESVKHIEHTRGWFSVDELVDFWAGKSPPLYFPEKTLVRARTMLCEADEGALVRVVHPLKVGVFRKTDRHNIIRLV